MSEKLVIPSRLPEELLVKCIEHLQTMRPTLLHLYKTSKQFRRLTIPVLYNNVELNKSSSIQRFLLRIIRDRSLALLVTALTLSWQDFDYLSYRPTDDPASRAELDEMLLAALDYNLNINRLEVNSDSTTVIILLCSVPNLVKLHIKSKFSLTNFRFFKPKTQFGTRFLPKLEHYIDEQEVNLPAVLCFFQLPSIRTMEFHGWSELPRNLGRYHGASPVESIYLEDCSIERDSLQDLLRVPRNLKHFSFEEGYVEHEWDDPGPSLFGESFDHAWDSLETLSLVNVDPEKPAVESFKNFKALTRLSVPFHLLPCSMSKETFHLVDILPPNLKHLELWYERQLSRSIRWTLDNCIESVREFLQERENESSPGKLIRIGFPKEYMWRESLRSLVDLGVRVGVVVHQLTSDL